MSRGAKKVVFVERGKHALGIISKNLVLCKMHSSAEVLNSDVDRAIRILHEQGVMFDLLLMDPPYRKGFLQSTLLELERRRIYHQESILRSSMIAANRYLTFRKLDRIESTPHGRHVDLLSSVQPPEACASGHTGSSSGDPA